MPPSDWLSVFERYATKTGFTTVEIPSLQGAPGLSTSARLWRSQYAEILTIELEAPAIDDLRSNAQIGQEWLDISCMALEKNDHLVMDAYLLLVSLTALPEDMLPTVRDIELDPTSCRKHVAWPLPGDDDELVWRRLLRVTALGLPTSPQASGMTNTPKLESPFDIRLLDDVKSLKVELRLDGMQILQSRRATHDSAALTQYPSLSRYS